MVMLGDYWGHGASAVMAVIGVTWLRVGMRVEARGEPAPSELKRASPGLALHSLPSPPRMTPAILRSSQSAIVAP